MESTVLSYLLIALASLGVVAVIVLIRTLGQFGQTAEALTDIVGTLKETAQSATATSDEARAAVSDIRHQVAPTLVKLDVAVDAVNANLLRLDSIMGDIESTTGQVANASNAVSHLANAPVEAVANLAERFRKAWKVRKAEVTEDVHRYSESLTHAAQQAGHTEYAPAGVAHNEQPAPAPAAESFVAPAPAPAPEPLVASAPAPEPLVVTTPAYEPISLDNGNEAAAAEYIREPAADVLYEDLLPSPPADEADSVAADDDLETVETHYEVADEPDVDDSDADFSSDDISRFSAAAVLSGSAGMNAAERAAASMSDLLAVDGIDAEIVEVSSAPPREESAR